MKRRRRGGDSLPLLTIPLDPVIWQALQDIATQQGRSVQDLVAEIAGDSLLIAIHVYVAEFCGDDDGANADE